MQERDLLEIIRTKQDSGEGPSAAGTQPTQSTVTLRRNDFRSSTKLEALLQHLRK